MDSRLHKKVLSLSYFTVGYNVLEGIASISVALLIRLGINYLYGLWWIDPVVGLIIVVFLIREGYATLKEGKVCCC